MNKFDSCFIKEDGTKIYEPVTIEKDENGKFYILFKKDGKIQKAINELENPPKTIKILEDGQET